MVGVTLWRHKREDGHSKYLNTRRQALHGNVREGSRIAAGYPTDVQPLMFS
jgi:hypothetical protein